MINNHKILRVISVLAILAIVILFIYLKLLNKSTEENQNPNPPATTTEEVVVKGVQYKNADYGFTFKLPDTWKDYSIIEDEWEGYSLTADGQSQTLKENGPLISIRHPDWDYKSPRQDIPVMVFTVSQWNDMQADKFHIGAAPINPSELGRNNKYVFAIPARYNFSYLTGFEEVDQIIRGDNFSAQ